MQKKSKDPIYATWARMVQRCTNAKSKDYKNWGGRGITICDQWRFSADNFYADMGDKPTPQHSLGRIDNDGNYEPSNCRWETRAQQASNFRYHDSQKRAVAAHAQAKRDQTHCKRGHEYTPENTYIHNGTRSCRNCRAAWDRYLYHGKKIPIEQLLQPIGKPGRPPKKAPAVSRGA